MLDLDRQLGTVGTVALLGDHADPDVAYYVNTRPRLSVGANGVPEFVFLVYRSDITDNPQLTKTDRDQLGGGFLAFTVDLTLSDAERESVTKYLSRVTGRTMRLAEIPVTKGSVRLSITKDAADAPGAGGDSPRGVTFFEDVYGTSVPSLIGGNRATFGVMLDHEGALLMRAALESGISPIGVIYDLTYLGLRPAFDVKVHADYKRVYDSLEIEFGVKAAYGPIAAAADIDLAWQKLRDEGTIRVEVQNFTDDADLRRQSDAAFEFFKTQLLTDFFKSSLEPPSFMRQGQSGGLLGSLTQLLGPLQQPQQATPTPTRGEASKELPTVLPAPTSVDSNTFSLADRNKAANPPAPSDGSGSGRGPQPGFGVQVAFSLKKVSQDELKVRDFEYSVQAAVSREMAPQGLFSTLAAGLDLERAIQEVSLDADFFKRINATFTLGADLAAEKIAAVTVNAEYPGVRPAGVPPATVDGFTFTPTDAAPKTFQSWLDDHLDLRYRYRIGVDFASDSAWIGDEPHFESDWIVTSDRSPSINPFIAVDRFDLEVALGHDVTADEVQSVTVELGWRDDVTGFSAEQTYDFLPGDPSRHWRLRFGATQQKVYRYRITYHLPDNVRFRTDWATSEPITAEAGSLVVNAPFQDSLALRLVPLLDPSQVVEADVDLLYREAATGYEQRRQVVFTGGAGPIAGQRITVPTIAADPEGLTATVTVVRADGSVFQGDPTLVPANVGVLPVTDGVGARHQVEVRLADPDLTGAGLVAVRVRVVGTGADGDSAEVLFLPGQPTNVKLWLVQPATGTPFGYSYEVLGYDRRGVPVPGASGSSMAASLVVGLPVP